MNIHYHPCKANVVDDALSRMSIGSTTYLKDGKMDFVKYVHRLTRLGVRLGYSTSGGVAVHPSFVSCLVVEVKKDEHLDPVLMELKDSVLVNMNKSFALGGDNILGYQYRLCVADVDDFSTRIVEQAHSSRYYVHPGSTKMYHDLKHIYR
ncbi:uncharacterized protein [Solanum lycopersicum]|uniref:uncharacterized protein n=1 Tax=Solanum lycopersicum TaxID=4081 RepID=UPI0037483DC3